MVQSASGRLATGATLTMGSSGPAAAALRRRLGLQPTLARFDEDTAEAVQAFRAAHGLGELPIADRQPSRLSIAERALRARNRAQPRSPARPSRERGAVSCCRYGRCFAAHLRKVASRAVQCAWWSASRNANPANCRPDTLCHLQTILEHSPDLMRNSIAPRVLTNGPSHLTRHRYAVFADWRRGLPQRKLEGRCRRNGAHLDASVAGQ